MAFKVTGPDILFAPLVLAAKESFGTLLLVNVENAHQKGLTAVNALLPPKLAALDVLGQFFPENLLLAPFVRTQYQFSRTG